MRQFPIAWLDRLNQMANGMRRRQGWGEIRAVVEPPLRPDHPPLLRLEKGGMLLIVPLDIRAVEQMIRTGQESPVLIEMRQAFMQIMKSAQRREKVSRPSGPPRKGGFLD